MHATPSPEAHPLADLPSTRRIDATMALLSALGTTPEGGWTVSELAELCGCSEAAIHARQKDALRSARHAAEALGLTPIDFRKLPE